MPSPPTRPGSLGPKNLSEARETIARLQAQLAGHGLPAGSQPIPKLPPPAPLNPDPSRPASPGTMQAPDFNLASISPKRFSETLELCDNKTLKILLSRECSKPGPE